MTTTIETAGAGDRAAAATTDTDRAALLTIAGADGPRVLESLVDECMEEEGAGAVRMKGTGSGRGENPEEDRAPGPRRHGKTSTRLRLPISPRRKCEAHMPPPTPDPGLYRGRALVRALGPDHGPDGSQEAARKASAPPFPTLPSSKRDQNWSFFKKRFLFVFDMNVTSIFSFFLQLHFKNDADPLLVFIKFIFR